MVSWPWLCQALRANLDLPNETEQQNVPRAANETDCIAQGAASRAK